MDRVVSEDLHGGGAHAAGSAHTSWALSKGALARSTGDPQQGRRSWPRSRKRGRPNFGRRRSHHARNWMNIGAGARRSPAEPARDLDVESKSGETRHSAERQPRPHRRKTTTTVGLCPASPCACSHRISARRVAQASVCNESCMHMQRDSKRPVAEPNQRCGNSSRLHDRDSQPQMPCRHAARSL